MKGHKEEESVLGIFLMEENVRLAYLYDFYGELLKPGQKELFLEFVFQDLSLQEMADELGISRQAVHDRVHRCIRILENYERKLHLLEKYQRIGTMAEAIEKELQEIESGESIKKKITDLLQEIVEVL